jgi:hypothetical protein
MQLPIITPAPIVVTHTVVFRDLFENKRQFRNFQNYLTGLTVLSNKSMANIARCVLDSADKTNLSRFLSEADRVRKIDVESFCEQILAIGKQFQEANGLASVYTTEQGGWHALSNREQVAQYLMGRYINNQPGVSSSLQVASSHTVSRIYPIH